MGKKILLILSMFLLVGCTNLNVSSAQIKNIINTVLENNNNLYNVDKVGYRYYLPRDFSIYEDGTYNQVLVNNGNKYYFKVDIISFYNKTKNEYQMEQNSYYNQSFSYNGLDGYVDIIKNNSFFYIKMMYNYSVIEVSVKENEINEAISYMTMILSSIKYNNKVIESTIGNNVLDLGESSYVLEGPKKQETAKNFLDYVKEYDNYEITNDIEDPDLIN